MFSFFSIFLCWSLGASAMASRGCQPQAMVATPLPHQILVRAHGRSPKFGKGCAPSHVVSEGRDTIVEAPTTGKGKWEKGK